MFNYTNALIQSDMYHFFLRQLICIFCLKSLKADTGHYFFHLTFWSVLVYKGRGFSCKVYFNLLFIYDIHYSSNEKDCLNRTIFLEMEVMKCRCLQCVLCKKWEQTIGLNIMQRTLHHIFKTLMSEPYL